MRVLVAIKANEQSEAGMLPSQQLVDEMTKYNEELVKAGIMLAADGLRPSGTGVRVVYEGGRMSVVDGPFAETKELIAGFWIWEVKNMDEAVEWAKRIPNSDGSDGQVEIRPIFDAEDFASAMEASK